MNLSDPFGTQRFGEQATRQGLNLAESLATGFMMRSNREEKERLRREAEEKAFMGSAFGLGGALIGGALGSQYDAPMVGAAIGSEAGKALIGRAQPENIVSAMQNQQTLDIAQGKLDQDAAEAERKRTFEKEKMLL